MAGNRDVSEVKQKPSLCRKNYHEDDGEELNGNDIALEKLSLNGNDIALEKLSLGPNKRKKLLVLDLTEVLCDREFHENKANIPDHRTPDAANGRFFVYKMPYCEECVKSFLERFDVGICSSAKSAGCAEVSAAGNGLATSTQSMAMQFSLPASTPFASTGSIAFSSGSSTFGFSSTSKLFSSGATFGLSSSTSSSKSIPASSIASPASTVFGSNWQAPKSSGFSSSSSSSTLFAFGATSNAVTTSGASVGFAPSVSSGPPFPFSSPAPTSPSQSVFGNPNPGFRFGSSPYGNNQQMSMEDIMAEDSVQATTPSVPVFFQQTATPGSIFGFSTPPGGNQFASTGSSSANPFQLESQPNLAAPLNSAFQASGSLEFNAGGSFSLGAGGSDKSGRKIVKVKRQQRKR